jgi:D-alanyl-D-alanine carboxypeptidase
LFRRLFFAFALLSPTAKVFSVSPVSAAIVVNAKNGEIIYSRNADQKTQPASLAKMATLLLTFKALKERKISFNSKICVSAYAASQRPTILGLKAGEFITVKNAVLALAVKSANDIAVALAERLGKTEKNFASMMNKEAKRLGMSSTIFFNASGWKDPRQLTTARDMAKLAVALLKEYPEYYHFFSNKQFYVENKRIKGHYALLGKRGDMLVDGIKTGYVAASGFNLAASAVKGKDRLIAVVLGGKTSAERNALTESLLTKGFSKLLSREVLAKNKRQRKIASVLPKKPELSTTPSGIYNKLNELPTNSEVKNERSDSNAVR